MTGVHDLADVELFAFCAERAAAGATVGDIPRLERERAYCRVAAEGYRVLAEEAGDDVETAVGHEVNAVVLAFHAAVRASVLARVRRREGVGLPP